MYIFLMTLIYTTTPSKMKHLVRSVLLLINAYVALFLRKQRFQKKIYNFPILNFSPSCTSTYLKKKYNVNNQKIIYFFLADASTLASTEITFPSITTPFPSMNATRESPSQFLKVSQTRGCCGAKMHWAISFDFSECGSSIFLPPVSFPIFHFSFEIRHA